MPRLFGTDGVRGVANLELTPELAFRLGKASAAVLAGETHHRPRFLIGSDTRISCAMLEAALVSGLCSSGADVSICGEIPTPGLAYLTRTLGFDAGAMISASHNSFEFNGIKFFNGEGYKLPDVVEDHIEALVSEEPSEDAVRLVGAALGRRLELPGGSDLYRTHLAESAGSDLSDLDIVIDCANGATCTIAPDLFRSLGARVTSIGDLPDGININDQCGSTHLGSLSQRVVDSGAQLGIAFDGDGDRMLAVDEMGKTIDGDQLMAMIALDMKKREELVQNTLVVTVMSNLGLDQFAQREGIRLVKTAVGDRYVLETMRKDGYTIGGEQSGHIILLDHATTGDGILSALRLLSIVKSSGARLSELASMMHVLPQVIRNARIPNSQKHLAMVDEEIVAICKETEASLENQGRLLVRASGTEPTIRVMIEGEDRVAIASMADRIVGIIERRHGVSHTSPIEEE